MTVAEIQARIKTKLHDGEPPVDVIAKEFDGLAGFFVAAAVHAVAGMLLSYRHGTPEMIVGFSRLAGLYGAIGAACRLQAKDMRERSIIAHNLHTRPEYL